MPLHYINMCDEKIREIYEETGCNNLLCTVVKIKTDEGWRYIDSPYEPEEEADRLIEKAGIEFDGLIVLGAGSGFLIKKLLEQMHKKLLVITGSKFLAEKNLQIIHKHSSSYNNITLICANTCTEALRNVVKEFEADKACIQTILHQREYKSFRRLFNPLLMVQKHKNKKIIKSVKRPENILFPCLGQILESDIKSIFISRGINVISIQSFAHDAIDYEKAWQIIETNKPDFIFSTNNKGSDKNGFIPEACSLCGIPWGTWFFDQPHFLVSRDENHKKQNRYGFCWDISGLDACCDLGFTNSVLLPLGTNHYIFNPGIGNPGLDSRLVYVGSPSFGSEDSYFAHFLHDRDANRIADEFTDIVCKKRILPTQQDILDVMYSLNIDVFRFPAAMMHRLPAFALYKANIQYRIAALSSLADLHPIVYGDGWEGLLPSSIELRGYVDYYKDLVHIYRSDAVHLSLTHLQMRLFPNQRIFDVGACGRIVLGETLPGLEELFGNEFNLLLFSDFNELYEKAQMLQNSKKHRQMLGDMLRERVLSGHTLSHRIDKVISVIFDNSGATNV